MGLSEFDPAARERISWNAGRKVGAKRALKPRQIWAVRFFLDQHRRVRDRALFDLAIDSKLRGCDLVKIRISDIVCDRKIRTRATVVQQKTGRPVQFELMDDARASLLKWLELRGGSLDEYVFPSRANHAAHVSTRQYARLVDEWITGIGLGPSFWRRGLATGGRSADLLSAGLRFVCWLGLSTFGCRLPDAGVSSVGVPAAGPYDRRTFGIVICPDIPFWLLRRHDAGRRALRRSFPGAHRPLAQIGFDIVGRGRQPVLAHSQQRLAVRLRQPELAEVSCAGFALPGFDKLEAAVFRHLTQFLIDGLLGQDTALTSRQFADCDGRGL